MLLRASPDLLFVFIVGPLVVRRLVRLWSVVGLRAVRLSLLGLFVLSLDCVDTLLAVHSRARRRHAG